jgi:putative DNA primase/helicase
MAANEPAAGKAALAGSRLARFSCWCPKVMAAIGRLPDTLADRCILVRMQRKTANEKCERLRALGRTMADRLRQQCARFVADHADAIALLQPPMPASLNDRAADLWEPLLVLADLAQQGWPERARAAAEALAMNARENSPAGSLFMDILLAFLEVGLTRLHSRILVAALNLREERPWRQLTNGRKMDEIGLARQLAPYGIRPRSIRMGDTIARGYMEEDFSEAFRRYIPASEMEEARRGSEERK